MNDPEPESEPGERARVRRQAEHRPAARFGPAELGDLAVLPGAEIAVRRSVIYVSGGLAPAAWR